MTTVLDRLSPREKWLIGIALPALALFAGWSFAWQPLAASRAALDAEIAEARTLIAAMEQVPEGGMPALAPISAEAPISVRLTRSAEATGIVLARIEPQDDELTAIVDAAPFNDVLSWIARMEDKERMRLIAVELDRRPEPGVVSVRLTLALQE